MTDDSSFIKPHTRVWVTFKETTVILSCVKDPSIYLSFSRPSRDHYGRHCTINIRPLRVGCFFIYLFTTLYALSLTLTT